MDIQILEEEVSASRPIYSQGDSLKSLQNEVSTIKEELESQKKEIKNIKHEMCSFF